MALSEHEQRLLDEMERHLYQNDADVVSTASRSNAAITPRAIVIALLSVAVGLGVVLGGVAAQLPIVGVLGFVLMLAGVLWAFTGPKGRGAAARPGPSPRGSSGKGAAGKPAPAADGTFMDRLGDRWERRQNGE